MAQKFIPFSCMAANPLKRIVLLVISIAVVLLLGGSLFASLGEPQIGDRIELYQTDLILQATELNEKSLSASDLNAVRKNLLGENPLKTALEDYQQVRQSAQANLERFRAKEAAPLTEAEDQLLKSSQQQQALIEQLDLRIGILQAKQDQTGDAIATWATLQNSADPSIAATATVLSGLWSDPPKLLPDAEPQLQPLDGWFRTQSLMQLYQLQQRTDALQPLQAKAQTIAQETLVKLAIVGALPAIGGMIGVVLLVIFVVQWLRRRKTGENLVPRWDVPWTWETVLQVLMIGFFFSGQIALPIVLRLSGINFAAFEGRASAVSTLIFYLLMATSALTVLYLSVRRYLPLPEGWFRLTGKRNWFLWGLGGYFVALPLMLVVSIVNQQIWQGQGGSNPLLQIVLEEGDGVALAMFFFTAAVAAPVFEEILFRGFLLPSLTRYFPVGGAIALSSLIFATAHLSLAEILPLTVLGAILGFVYTRSRGLLSPMILHSLWNSVTMVGLFILGSGVD
jgi:uncharacterized protein